MRKSWEETWTPDGPRSDQQYHLRIYDDMSKNQPTIFVVERSDGQPVTGPEGKEIHAMLAEDAGVETGNSKLWEQTPNGDLYVHEHSNRYHDVNPLKNDMDAWAYENDVKAGNIEPQLAEVTDYSRNAVSQEQAQEITGQEIRSYEQQQNLDFNDLRGPSQSYD